MGLLTILREPWLWIIIIVLSSILIGPFFILYILLLLPDFLKIPFTIFILIIWSVVGGYKDWVLDKRKQKTKKIYEDYE